MTPVRIAIARFLFGLGRPSKAGNTRSLRKRGESVASFAIRDAVAADIPALARLHVETWNATYRTNGPSYQIRERQWRDAFARTDGSWFCFVVQRADGELIGFAKGTRSELRDYPGELNKIYLRSDYQRLGLGRRLVGHVARHFLDQGITSMCLFAEASNPSCRFYEALDGENLLNADGTVNYANYGWRDLVRLASRCRTD